MIYLILYSIFLTFVALTLCITGPLNRNERVIKIYAGLFGRYFRWGTYGKSGREPLKTVRLVDCSSAHLANIYAQRNVPIHYLVAIEQIMESRAKKIRRAPLSKMPLYINDEYSRFSNIAKDRLAKGV